MEHTIRSYSNFLVIPPVKFRILDAVVFEDRNFGFLKTFLYVVTLVYFIYSNSHL
jgi:hypothetical protein